MRHLDRLWPPSLVRRLCGTLLLAFALVWPVQMALIFWQSKDQTSIDENLRRRAETLLSTLDLVNSAEEARAAMRTAHGLFNQNFDRKLSPNQVALQLQDASGQPVYTSPALGAHAFTASAATWTDQQTGPLHWRVAYLRSAKWALWVAETPWQTGWLLRTINQRMAPYVALSFFLILLPLGWAMSRGLKPLKDLSRKIEQRSADDLSPLHFATRYQELKPLASSLDRLLSDLLGKIAREHAFVQDAAHELRTPLAAIQLHAHATTKSESASDRAAAEAGLQHGVQRASHLIDQLLLLAQMDADRSASAQSDVDLAACIRQEIALFAPSAMQKGLVMSLAAPEQMLARIDVNAFRAIAQNLLSNAVRYTPADGQIAVELLEESVRRGPSSAVLRVLDTGPGIAADQHALVFERFHRGAHPEIAGSGLGLAIVKQACMRMGGSVALTEGLNGRGLGVVVCIPLIEPAFVEIKIDSKECNKNGGRLPK